MTTAKINKITVKPEEHFSFNSNSQIYGVTADENLSVTIIFLEFCDSKKYEYKAEILKFEIGENFNSWGAKFLCEKDGICYFMNQVIE